MKIVMNGGKNMTKNERWIIQDNLIRIQRNCEFYEHEGRIEALKQECGRLGQTLHLAFDLGVDTEFIIEKARKYIKMSLEFRAEEDIKAEQKYRKRQEEYKNAKK